MLSNEFLAKLKTNQLPKKHFGKEQQARMRSINLECFMLWYDSTLIYRPDSSCRLVANKSVVLHEQWARDFAKDDCNISGQKNPCTGLDFCMQYLGLTFYQAMYVINEFFNEPQAQEAPLETHTTMEQIRERLKSESYIPAAGNRQVFAYLLKTRHIELEVIRDFQRAKCLYAEVLPKGYNLLFPFWDFEREEEGEIIGFERCGLLSDGQEHRYKGCIVTEPHTCFSYIQNSPITNKKGVLMVFESAIDMMSFLSLVASHKIRLPIDRAVTMISVRGLHYKAYKQYIDQHPNIAHVVLCVDGDEAGNRFAEKVKREEERDYSVTVLSAYLVSNGVKDWNELLKVAERVKNVIDVGLILPPDTGISFDDLWPDEDDDDDLPF